MRVKTRRSRPIAALFVAVAMIAAACGNSQGSAGSESDATEQQPGDDRATAEVLGEPNPANGEPLVVGFVADTGGEAVEISEYKIAVDATAEYVNEYLGGIGGRPIKVEHCETRQSAGTAAQCVNQFVQDGVSALLVGSSGFGETLAQAAGETDLPYVAYSGGSLAELTGPTSFVFAGDALNILGAPALYMQDEGLQKLAVLVIDLPTITQAVDGLAVPTYERLGLDLEVITVPPGTADMSASVVAGGNADAWLILGDVAFCTTALDAIQTQSPDAPVFVSGQCISPDVAPSLPNGFEGVLTAQSTRLDPADEETAIFWAVLDEYVDEDLSGLAPGFLADGFALMLGFDRLMEGYTGDGSAETMLEHLKAASAPLPLGGGIEIDCGNPPVELLSAVCSSGAWLTERTADGSPTDFVRIDPAPLFEL